MKHKAGIHKIIPGLTLEQYRKQIKLDEQFVYDKSLSLSDNDKDKLVNNVVDFLINEHFTEVREIPDDYLQKRDMLRALLNIRPPLPLNDTILNDLNLLLQYETQTKKLVEVKNISSIEEMFSSVKLKNSDIIALWKGDITSLKCDAIVNAANDQMLGCFHPLHNCIDNVIHSAAGPMLRDDCNTIMEISKKSEQTGDAKITRAYNLPSKYVIHTVGPIIQKIPVTEIQCNLLASCYNSCLSLACQAENIKTIAFPCISTGVYNFPRDTAAQVAVQAVEEWLNNNPNQFEKIIFNVFLQEDFDEYARVFSK